MWQDNAACAGTDPNVMQPDRPRPSTTRHATRLCASCPVFEACEQAAQEHDAYGVWAGRWYGEYDPLGVFDVAAEWEFRALLSAGMVERDIAAHLDVTRAQVRAARVEVGDKNNAA